jgi:hypothetical protein
MRENLETRIRNLILSDGWVEGDYNTAERILNMVNQELKFNLRTINSSKCTEMCDGFEEVLRITTLR